MSYVYPAAASIFSIKIPYPPCRVIHQHMGHRAHQFAILNNRTAAHE